MSSSSARIVATLSRLVNDHSLYPTSRIRENIQPQRCKGIKRLINPTHHPTRVIAANNIAGIATVKKCFARPPTQHPKASSPQREQSTVDDEVEPRVETEETVHRYRE
jgi:hypothetical protein